MRQKVALAGALIHDAAADHSRRAAHRARRRLRPPGQGRAARTRALRLHRDHDHAYSGSGRAHGRPDRRHLARPADRRRHARRAAPPRPAQCRVGATQPGRHLPRAGRQAAERCEDIPSSSSSRASPKWRRCFVASFRHRSAAPEESNHDPTRQHGLVRPPRIAARLARLGGDDDRRQARAPPRGRDRHCRLSSRSCTPLPGSWLARSPSRRLDKQCSSSSPRRCCCRGC